MLKPSMQELLKQVGNRYLLVNITAQRARDIVEEAEEAEVRLDEKAVQIALNEIADGKVLYRPGPKTETVIVQNHAIAMAMLDVEDDEDELEAYDEGDLDGYDNDSDEEELIDEETIKEESPVEDDYGDEDIPVEDR